MKRNLCALALLLFASWSRAQVGYPPVETSQLILPVYSVNLDPATQANVSLVGNPGPQTIYYWMVSNFTLGPSSPIFAGSVSNAPNVLSSGNYIAVTPVYPADVTSIDLLKTSSPSPPTGACNCAVATGVTAGTINDQSNSTSSYTVNPVAVDSFVMTIDNEVQSAGVTHAILRQNGRFVADLSTSGGFTVGGDLASNSSTSQEVIGILNHLLPGLSSGFLQWNGSAWVFSPAITGPTASGGLVQTGTTLGLLTSCSTNQVLQWNGSAWVCASAGAGTITGATTNGGLVVTGSTLGMLTSCSTNQVLQWNGTAWVCATGGTGTVTGTGTNQTVPLWSGASALTNSVITQGNLGGSNGSQIQVGTGTPLNSIAPFFVNATVASGATSSCNYGASFTLPFGASAPCYGAFLEFSANNTNSTGMTTGLQIQNSSQEAFEAGLITQAVGNGTSQTEIRALEADAEPSSGGITTARGIVAFAGNYGGTTTTNQGVYIKTQDSNGLSIITNNYGLFVDSPSNTGTITNNYGILVADQTATGTGGTNTNPFAIKTLGVAPTSFGGPLAIAGQVTATEPTGSIWGSATGGAKGAGTINAAGLFVNGVAVGSGGSVTSVATGNGLTGGTFTTSGTVAALYPVDGSLGYTSGDPCATINSNITGWLLIAPNISLDLSGFANKFTNGLVPCNSNPFENTSFSGEVNLGPTVFVTSRPWLTPGGGTNRVTLRGGGTADVGAGATPAVNSMLTDCTATAPAAYNWNGTSCTVNGIVVPTLANGGGHSLSFTFPHGAFGAGTYWPLLWIGGQGSSGVSLGGNFGQVIENFTVAPNGVGGADFGVYSAGSQEQTWCRNVTVRDSNSAAFFFDSVESTANIGHFSMNGCEGRMDTTETAAQGYPNVANQKGMGYGIFVEGNSDVIYFTGGTCTTYPQGYPTTFSGGAITAIKMTYAGSCSSLTGLTCHVGTNASKGTGETCGFTNTGTTVTGITAGGVGTGYSLGDTLSGGPFEIANSSMDGKSGSLMQNAIVLDGMFSPHLMSIHTGWDADYGVVIGYGAGAITGGLFENIDLENTSNGVYRLGVGIDNNQKLLTTGKGGSIATIRDDANNFSSPTNTPISEYDPASFWIPAGQAPIFFNGLATAQILDFTNQLPVIKPISVTSAVDYITVTPAATANPATVTITAAGTDSNINLNLVSKGAGAVECNGSPCGGGSSGISGMTALGVPIAATATTITSSTTAGTNQGTYFPVRVNTVQGTAVTLTEQQAGVGGRAITGSTSTDAAAYSDVNNVIDHDNGGSAGVTETLATPTTLNNSSFGAVYWNNSTQTDTLKATTNTIQSGSAAAVAGATGISLLPGQAAAFKVDPNLSTQWLAHVTDQAGFINGAAFSGTNGHLVAFGASNIPADSGLVGSNVVTASGTLTSGNIMTGAGTKTSQTNTTGTGVVTALGVNTGTAGAFGLILASGTSAMGTGAISSGTCATVVTTTATGAATTDNLLATPTADPTGVTGYGPSASGSLYIQAYITSGNVNFKVCNNTSGSITPSALTMQWRVIR